MHLLLIHGALGAGPQLEPLKAAFGGAATIHVVELEGHGATPSALPDYSIQRFADQVRAFIVDRDLGPVAIFGYSMGGYVALMLAAESPNLVARVVTLGTKLAWSPEVAALETSRLNPAKIRAKVPKFADQLDERHRALEGGWEGVLARTATLMTSLGAQPSVDAALLSRIQQPVRLMVGDRDSVVSVDETAGARTSLPLGELVVLPGTPHPIEQVRLPLLASLLNDFLV